MERTKVTRERERRGKHSISNEMEKEIASHHKFVKVCSLSSHQVTWSTFWWNIFFYLSYFLLFSVILTDITWMDCILLSDSWTRPVTNRETQIESSHFFWLQKVLKNGTKESLYLLFSPDFDDGGKYFPLCKWMAKTWMLQSR